MDPGAWVFLGVIVTTIGLIVTTYINNRRERTGSADAGVSAGLDDKNVLKAMLDLIADKEKLEKMVEAKDLEIQSLRSALEGDEANDGTHA